MTGLLEQRAGLGGKVAFVIGGAAGLGRAVCLGLAGCGVDVAFCDVDEHALDETAESIRALGRKGHASVADVTRPGELAAFYQGAAAAFDRLDILVNVAGGICRRPFMDGSPEQCNADIRLNFGYVIESVRHAIPLIRAGRRGGSVVNFTTVEAHRGAAGFSVYAGAKAATANFTRAMGVEFGPERIRFNAVASDTTDTRGNRRSLEPPIMQRLLSLPPAIAMKQLEMYVPLKAPPSTDDVANTVLFLASDLSAGITGTTVVVDGGTLAAGGWMDWPFGDGQLPAPGPGTLQKLFGD